MEIFKIQLIETIVLIVIYIILFQFTKTYINNTLKSSKITRRRRKTIIRIIHSFTTIASIVVISAIWGLKQHEIAVYVSTILTAFGIAFFAQWSLLSNVTSSIVLFFNHPIRIGDMLKVMDKDCPFEGEITDLTYFFVHIKTSNGETITIPNSQLLQKAISVKPKDSAPIAEKEEFLP